MIRKLSCMGLLVFTLTAAGQKGDTARGAEGGANSAVQSDTFGECIQRANLLPAQADKAEKRSDCISKFEKSLSFDECVAVATKLPRDRGYLEVANYCISRDGVTMKQCWDVAKNLESLVHDLNSSNAIKAQKGCFERHKNMSEKECFDYANVVMGDKRGEFLTFCHKRKF